MGLNRYQIRLRVFVYGEAPNFAQEGQRAWRAIKPGSGNAFTNSRSNRTEKLREYPQKMAF